MILSLDQLLSIIKTPECKWISRCSSNPPCAEYLKRIRPGSSVLLYLEVHQISVQAMLSCLGNANAAHESISVLIQVEAGDEKKKEKKKPEEVPKVKYYQVDVRQCLPMTIVAFSLGSTLHLMTDLED